MNNENNNLNGTVLGSVDNLAVNNNPVPNGNPGVQPNVQPNPFPTSPVGPFPTQNSTPNNGVVNNQANLNNGVNPNLSSPNFVNGASAQTPMPAAQNPVAGENVSSLGSPNNNYMATPNNSNNASLETQNLNNSANLMGNNGLDNNFNSAPTPNLEPAPNYTNPNVINNPTPAPMPGFEGGNSIGTTPPITFEQEQQPKKKKNNNIFFIILVLLVLACVGFGTYYVLKYTDIFSSPAQVTIDTKDVEINMGEKLSTNLENYATITGTDVKNCNLDVLDVDTNKPGNYEYKVTCGETMRKGKVTVIDNRSLEVETTTVYKAKGDTINASEFAKLQDNTLTYEFVDSTAVNNYLNGDPGTYTVKIKVTSNDNKTAEVEGTLVITEYKIKGYYTCTSTEQNVNNLNAKMTTGNKFAIQDDENNSFGNIAYEEHTFIFSDETEYRNTKANYTTNGTITINNITGNPTFDDENKKIVISKELTSDDLNTQFGASNIATYMDISKYFRNTLGYSCTYEKVQ